MITKFGDFTGQYPWHCHVLEHEEQAMMRPFEVVAGDSGGRGPDDDSGGRSQKHGKPSGRDS